MKIHVGYKYVSRLQGVVFSDNSHGLQIGDSLVYIDEQFKFGSGSTFMAGARCLIYNFVAKKFEVNEPCIPAKALCKDKIGMGAKPDQLRDTKRSFLSRCSVLDQED